ncbi:MAG: hypothetical protein J2P32_01925 [Actinobacteria bacterium]|nr:hypothetical protein [Actinomycetota bacterium]
MRRVLAAVLPHGLHVDIRARQSAAPAFDVTVTAGEAKHRFIAAWAGEGWPSDVERLIKLVPDADVVMAARLSDGARRRLSRSGLGWADEAGHADISRKSGLAISRQPGEAGGRREPSARWTPATLAVAEATLSGITPTVLRMEQATGLSRHATATALSRLERLGFLERPGALRGPRSARRVVNVGAFLDAYAEAAARQRRQQVPVLVHRLWNGDPLGTLAAAIGPALVRAHARWAVTGTAASVLLAPYLSDVTTLELYLDAETLSDQPSLASLLGGRIVERGHRIEIREIPTRMALSGPVIDGIQIALPVRVYADLRALGGRNEEAAQHLRETLNAGTAT